MDRTAVIAVVGTCEPERRLHAQKIASETGFEVITAERLAIAMDPIREAMALIPWAQADGVVVEYPIQAPILDVIGSLADPEEPTRLVDIVCVLDATHFFSELSRTDRVEHLQVHHGMPFQAVTARSLFAAQHIEYCSTALVVNGRNLPPEDDSLMVSVIGELSPLADVVRDGYHGKRLHDVEPEPRPEHGSMATDQIELRHPGLRIRPGWIAHLNGQHTTPHRNPRVASMRYTNPRPFHPLRLQRVLDEYIEPGTGGSVIRSCGFCRLATRQGVTAQWSHAGGAMVIEPLARDDAAQEPLSFGQDIILTGVDLQPTRLTQALDDATLNDRELLSAPETWNVMPDPFPVWVTADERYD